MTAPSIAERFADAASAFTTWLEAGVIDAPAAFDHLVALYALARALPHGARGARRTARPERPGAVELKRLTDRLAALPILDYAITDPYAVDDPGDPMIGNLASDLIEIHLCLRRGLALWSSDREAAIWDWRLNFIARWRTCVRDALWVLDRVLADDA